MASTQTTNSSGGDAEDASAPDAKPTLGERISSFVLKPPKPGSEHTTKDDELTLEELEATVKTASDKERAVGLIAAPVAALLGIMITDALVAHDPAAMVHGHVNPLHVNPSIYHSLTLVLLGLSVLILVTALLRKRMFLGITLALYGLAVFNLHYWGFGVPFVMAGAWYLVRTYRFQRQLKDATEKAGPVPSRSTATGKVKPQANKRYTPKTAS